MDSFDYLGARLTKHGGTEDDIKNRPGKATGAFNKLATVWRSGQLSKNINIRVFKSNVIAVLLYGCETWRMTKRDEAKLDTFLHKCLRRLLKIYWPMEVSNEEVRRRGGTCTISEQIRRRRWRCVAYEQPTESTHCLNLGTRREEDQRATEGDMEKNCRRGEAEDGFRHLDRSCYHGMRQSRLEETSQRPYSPRRDRK